jgi:RNA polymerase sigma factor (sigma-70 family)
MTTDLRRTIEALWRMEAPGLIATLARRIGDVGVAEDLASEAFVAALEQWPAEGIPPRPGAWLMATARHKAIDRARREEAGRRKAALIAVQAQPYAPDVADDLPAPIADDVLTLIFIACHPILSRQARVALTLRLIGGLSTDEIARAFLVPPATLGQRIARAKRTLTEAQVPFEPPDADELPPRVGAVLEVVYLIFNEGYSASSGDGWVRRELAQEAMRLGRVLAGLLPTEPEVFGLLALMELHASRFATRAEPDGTPVLLDHQDRSRWDRILIAHGLSMLDRAAKLGRPLGPYAIQAAIAAHHCRARTFAETDWTAIVALYDALTQVAPSPIVDLNRAVALLYADGPQAALAAIDAIRDDKRLARYHLLGAVRADILIRLGRAAEAAEELEHAADLAPTRHERQLLRRRMADALAGKAADTAH